MKRPSANGEPAGGPSWPRLLEQAQAAWGGRFAVPEEAFRAYLLERLGEPAADAAPPVADLYLACACARGDAEAISVLSHGLDEQVVRPLRRRYHGQPLLDDLRQHLVTLLLYGDGAGGARIGQYQGRGRLWAWLRVIAARELQGLLAPARREVSSDADLLDAAVGGAEPELRWLREEYRGAFRRSFRLALSALSVAERVLLKQHYLDGMTIDRLAVVYRTHRATMARRLQRLREDLFLQTQRRMQRELRIDPGEFADVMQLLQSQLDASIEHFLGDPARRKTEFIPGI